jgi:SAM-dependent methyltransferase
MIEGASMGDAFGKALMACYRGESCEHVIERDDGLVEVIDTKVYFRGSDEWPQYERDALKEIWGRVLDVGCGAGREALRMQEEGLEVVAIDVSPLAVELACLRGVRDCRLMDVRMLDFPEGYFDAVVTYGNNFGVAGDIEATRNVLRLYYKMTKADGVVLAATRDPLNTENPVHIAYHEQNRRTGRPPGLVRIRVGFEGEFDDYFDLLMVSLDELVEVVEPTGWYVDKVYDSGEANYIAVLSKST